jgi:signal transduction histidine kinase
MSADKPIQILLAEDDEADAELFSALIEQEPLASCVITRVASLGEAMTYIEEEHLKSQPIDIVLLDLFLPDSRGFETLTRLHDVNTAIPVVVLTGIQDQEAGLLAVRSGAQDFLVKGKVQPEALWRTISFAVERSHLQAQLKDTQQQLLRSQKIEAVGRLARGIAHDFNNVLTVIMGSATSLVERSKDNEKSVQLAKTILDGSERASKLIKQLVAFSRRQIIEMKVVDMNSIIESMSSMFKVLLGASIETQISLSKEPCLIHGDHGQIEQILLNLCVNAKDAMPDGGTFSISTSQKSIAKDLPTGLAAGDYVQVIVRDTGAGMDDKTIEKIFEPFFTTKPVGKGNGLGLSIVWSVVKQHKGFVSVDSKPGTGAAFSIWFPRILQATTEARPETKNLTSEASPAAAGETILVVDDENELRKMLAFALEGSGYRVLQAEDGNAALQILNDSHQEIRVVISDLIMPNMNGLQLARAIKTNFPDMPLMFMTGHPPEGSHEDDALLQEHRVLLKPFPPRDLLRSVKELLSPKSS